MTALEKAILEVQKLQVFNGFQEPTGLVDINLIYEILNTLENDLRNECETEQLLKDKKESY